MSHIPYESMALNYAVSGLAKTQEDFNAWENWCSSVGTFVMCSLEAQQKVAFCGPALLWK